MAQPQAAWAEDIQIPVPDQGPIPLMGRADAHAAYDSAPRASAGRDGATVAALAHTLAKTAVVALEDEELVEAREVNFEHIDPSKRTDVSERFADAMQEPGSEPSPFLQPGLLDEVLRNEFPREAAPPSDDQDELLDLSEFPEPPLEANLPAPQAETAFDPAQQEWWQAQETGGRMEHPQNQKHSVETPMQRTVTQAQFTGAELAQPLAGGARSLEDSVREMLRPILVQWLNENMPRILENAIREEIAQRGLLPKQN
jgi:hypothetical protein